MTQSEDFKWPASLNIIIMPLSRYDGEYSSAIYSLAQEFAQHTRVFFLDNPYTYKDVVVLKHEEHVKRRKNSWKSNGEWLNEIKPNLYNVSVPIIFPINFLPKGNVYQAAANYNNGLISKRVKQLIKRKKIENYVFINGFNPFYPIKFPKKNPPKIKVYHCMDAMEESKYVGKHGADLEEKMIMEYDLTITTSNALKKAKQSIAKAIQTVPNAADNSFFTAGLNHKTPIEIETIGAPVVMYVGNIDFRLDYALLKKAANQLATFNFVFVGPFGSNDYKEEGLDKLENVHFLGVKKLNEIPALLASAQCTIIPFKRNALTAGIYPLKINEYLSTGKPVVSTNFSEDIATFSSCIALENEGEAFAKAIKQSVETDSPEKEKERQNFVQNNSWAKRSKEFLHIVHKHIKS